MRSFTYSFVIGGIAVLALTLGASTARAAPCPLGGNCIHDPKAWGAMAGSSPEERKEQQDVIDAVRAELQERQVEKARQLRGMPIRVREEMVATLEDEFSQLTGRRYTVLRVNVIARGEGFLFCGVAITGASQSGFVFDTDAHGIHEFNATIATFKKAACGDPLAVQLR